MGFKTKLKDVLIGTLSDEELLLLPRGFQTIGNVVIIKLNPKLMGKKKKNWRKIFRIITKH